MVLYIPIQQPRLNGDKLLLLQISYGYLSSPVQLSTMTHNTTYEHSTKSPTQALRTSDSRATL